jgi:hypothetical protein
MRTSRQGGQMVRFIFIIYFLLGFFVTSVPQYAYSEDGMGTLTGHLKANRRNNRHKKNTIVYLKEKSGGFKDSFIPSTDTVTIMLSENQFKTRITPLLHGTPITFLNTDAHEHYLYSQSSHCRSFEDTILDSNEAVTNTFEMDELVQDCLFQCHHHPDLMKSIGYIVYLTNPYYDQADIGGGFVIENIPPGVYTIATWGEYTQSTDLQEVLIGPNEDTHIVIPIHRRKK